VTKKTQKTKAAAKPKPVAKKRPAKRAARKVAARRPPARKKPASKKPAANRWVKLVEKHGIVLASARGPVPSVAEAVAGEPIIGSWWAHPKGKAIFAALSEIDDSPDVRCFKLVDGKVTFVHRRLWPALVRLADELGADRLAEVRQEHTERGAHRNELTPFPKWVPADVKKAAAKLGAEEARAQLPALETATGGRRRARSRPGRRGRYCSRRR